MIKDFYLKDNLEITVIGDAMLDKYIIGSSDRISPEAPVPVPAELTVNLLKSFAIVSSYYLYFYLYYL